MARAGVTVDESIDCVGMGAGAAADRLVDIAASTAAYRAVSIGADRFQFARTYRPTWAVVVGISLTPLLGLGLLLLLVKKTETWTATIEQDHRAARIRITGKVLPNVLLAVRAALAGEGRPSAPAASWTPTPPPAQPAGAAIATATTGAPAVLPAPPVVGATGLAAPPGGSAGWAGAPMPGGVPAPPSHVIAPPPMAGHAGRAPMPAVPPTPGPAASPRPVKKRVVKKVAVARPANPTAPSAVVPPATHDGDDDGATRVSADIARLRAARSEGGPVLAFDTGQVVPATALVVLGRDPAPSAGDVEPLLVAVEDPDLSVSKTHLAVGLDAGHLWVEDRGSTNGTSIEGPDGAATGVQPGVRVAVPAGATVRLGERRFALRDGDGGLD